MEYINERKIPMGKSKKILKKNKISVELIDLFLNEVAFRTIHVLQKL